MNNITKIISQKMCCGCGACSSICPQKSITMIEGESVNYPHVNNELCIDCGLCLNVCPGKMNIDRLVNNERLDIEANIKKVVIAHSTNEELRTKSASGGAITQVLKGMFEENEIDAALIVCQSYKNVLLNDVKIVNNIDDLMESQGSRYSPASNCVKLREIVENDKYNNVAFVGKPCDIEALNKYKQINKMLAKKIKMSISIMCHHSPTRKGIVKLLNCNKINVNNIKTINFRGNGWPGKFSVEVKSGEKFSISYFDAWNNYLSRDYNEKCSYCDNPFPLDADMIVGDPWGEEFNSDKLGKSLILVRSNYANQVLNNLQNKNALIIVNSTYESVKKYQKNLLVRYNEFNINSIVFRKIHGYKVPLRDVLNLVIINPKIFFKYLKVLYEYRKNYREWEYK